MVWTEEYLRKVMPLTYWYDGKKLKGKIDTVFVNGHIAVEGGKVNEDAFYGRPLEFK